ncbi:MAG: putative manganese transporter, partial [Pseudomonadota bacterium]|nr:putative manganese transporter [Pseudomonadota bacterium]
GPIANAIGDDKSLTLKKLFNLNDGDALFPAIALAPGAAVMATLYSAIPALLISYGWFFLAHS